MNAIEIRQLVKRFGPTLALDALDLNVPTGSIFAFIGPNGAGKTTTLNLMTGLAKATSGSITIGGIAVGQGAYPSIGFLPDTPDFYGWMSAYQFLDYIAHLHHMEKPAIDETLEWVGLSAVRNRKLAGFSRGMKQRLGLAQAILPRPAVLLLDEPVSALDPSGRKDILDLMNYLRGQMTIFFSTHILNDAERVCDHVGIIHQGKLLIQADRDTLLAQFIRPVFEIEFLPDDSTDVSGLVRQLETAPWVEKVEQQGLHLRLTVRDASFAQWELIQQVGHLPLLRFERANATLEDIFLMLTGNPKHVSTPIAERTA